MGRACVLVSFICLHAVPASAVDDKILKTPTAPAATPTSAAIADLQKTLSGMGYTIGQSESDWFSFDAGTYHVTTDFSGDASRVFFEIRYDLPADKMTVMPSGKALEWNGSHADYFGYIRYADKSASWMLEASIPTSSAQPKVLRSVIDNLVHDAVTEQAILDPSGW